MYVLCGVVVVLFKQKTAYEMRISDWSSDVCSSDLLAWVDPGDLVEITPVGRQFLDAADGTSILALQSRRYQFWNPSIGSAAHRVIQLHPVPFLVRLLQSLDGGLSTAEYSLFAARSEEHTSELQSLMRTSYAVLCLKKNNNTNS